VKRRGAEEKPDLAAVTYERVGSMSTSSAEVLARKLLELGVRGVLVRMASRGQLLEIKCEMQTCYCEKGRDQFDPWPTPRYAPGHDWSPNADHHPRLKEWGGKLEPANVRLAHVYCNNMDYGWRSRVRKWLEADPNLSFDDIAQRLNRRKIDRPKGVRTWTAKSVRRAYLI
jgi:hypothetical protein